MSDTGFVVGGRIFRNKPKEPPRETPASNGFVAGNRIFRKTPPEPSVTTPPDDRNLFQQFGDFVTGGEEREGQRDQTEIVTQLMYPSLDPATDPLADVPQANQSKALAGILSKMDPKARLDILKANIPDLKVIDENTVEVGGKQFIVNKKGFSNIDAQSLLAGIAAFAGPTKILNYIKGGFARGAAALPAFAGTQIGLETLGETLGSEQGVDLVNAGIVGAFGAGFTWASPAISKLLQTKGLLDDAGELTGYGTKILDKLKVPDTQRTPEFLSVFNQMFKNASGSITAGSSPAAVRAAQAESFGFQLTKGQKTQDLKQLSKEKALVDQEPFKSFIEEQANDVHNATAALQRKSAPETTRSGAIPTTQQEAGQNVQDIILGRVKKLEDLIQTAYRLAGSSAEKAVLDKKSFQGYAKAMLEGLKNQGGFTKSRTRTVDQLAKLRRMLRTERGGPATRARGGPDFVAGMGGTYRPVANPLTMQKIERFRQGLVDDIKSASISDTADAASLIVMKGELDKWLDGAFKNAFFSGDQQALNQMKRARKLYKTLRGRFFKRGRGDVAGNVLEKMIVEGQAGGMNSVTAMNTIFGGPQFGYKGQVLAKRLGEVLGKESGEWKGIQGAAIHKVLFGEKEGIANFSAKEVSKRLDNFLEGRGAPISRELFNKAQLTELSQFSSAIKSTLPQRGSAASISKLKEFVGNLQEKAGYLITGGAAVASLSGDVSPMLTTAGMMGGAASIVGGRGIRAGGLGPSAARTATSQSYRHYLPAPASVPLFTGVGADVGRRTAEEVPAELLASNVMSMIP
jgi:hypothetical protein